MKTHAVLTGDLIGSRKLDAAGLERAVGVVRRLASEFAEIHEGAVAGSPDFFRGDGWQVCLRRPSLAVTCAVFFRAGLKAENLDTRIGIGLGIVEALNEEHISRSSGSAFVASGGALDSLDKDRSLSLAHAAEPPPEWAQWLRETVVPLLDGHVAGWTQRESVAVYGTLRKLTQSAVAELPLAQTQEGAPPTRQAVQDALRRIRWSTHLQPVLDSVETLLEKRRM